MAITKASSSAVAPAAKGDLVVGNATNDSGILAVGSADQVLTVDSSTTTGLKWATASAGGMTLLSTTTLSGTTTTISSISGAYKDLLIVVSGAIWGTGSSQLDFVPNGTSNSYGLCNRNTASTVDQAPITTKIRTGRGVTNTGGNNVLVLLINNYANTSYYKPFSGTGFQETVSGDTGFGVQGSFRSNSAITSFNIENTSGYTFTAGQVLIYGVK